MRIAHTEKAEMKKRGEGACAGGIEGARGTSATRYGAQVGEGKTSPPFLCFDR